ncbi:MAG: TetR/AcrR family transcriptional regulator [Azospirillaceae bacterium]|nr:TetR/AcrR family transcriptional regulator [Azospirillaceae bacterium]
MSLSPTSPDLAQHQDPEIPAAPVISNKNGQKLGRKGLETRGRLTDAARRLLAHQSPFDLTVVAIAREAALASATFYLYFDDVQDVLYALSDEAGAELRELDLRVRPGHAEEDALAFVETFYELWRRHAVVLSYRNLESDRGNPRFMRLRTATAIPVLNRLCDLILAGAVRNGSGKGPSRMEAYAEGIVIFSAIEQIAAVTLQYPEESLHPVELKRAQARILARTIGWAGQR